MTFKRSEAFTYRAITQLGKARKERNVECSSWCWLDEDGCAAWKDKHNGT